VYSCGTETLLHFNIKIVFASVGLVAFGVVLRTLMAKFSLMRSSSAVAAAAPLPTLVLLLLMGQKQPSS
jgi:hypothetical protein